MKLATHVMDVVLVTKAGYWYGAHIYTTGKHCSPKWISKAISALVNCAASQGFCSVREINISSKIIESDETIKHGQVSYSAHAEELNQV